MVTDFHIGCVVGSPQYTPCEWCGGSAPLGQNGRMVRLQAACLHRLWEAGLELIWLPSTKQLLCLSCGPGEIILHFLNYQCHNESVSIVISQKGTDTHWIAYKTVLQSTMSFTLSILYIVLSVGTRMWIICVFLSFWSKKVYPVDWDGKLCLWAWPLTSSLQHMLAYQVHRTPGSYIKDVWYHFAYVVVETV